MSETTTKSKKTVSTAETSYLLKYYKKTTRPELRAAIAKELNRRGVKLPKNTTDQNALWVVIAACVVIIGLGAFYLNSVSPRKDFSPRTVPVEQAPLQAAIRESSSEGEQSRISQLETANQNTQAMLKKLDDRIWMLGVLSQENLSRIQHGDRDMLMMQRDWTPEQNDYIRRMTNAKKVRASIEARLRNTYPE